MVSRALLIFLMTLGITQTFGRNVNKVNNLTLFNSGNVDEVNLNKVFDENIDSIRRVIYENHMDPLRMPERTLGIPDSFQVAKLHLRDGWVQQLATIKRTGDIIARINGRNLTVEFDLGWDDIDVNYIYVLKALHYTREGNFHGYFNNVRIEVQGNINLDNHNIKLKYLRIINAEHFHFELTGHTSDYLINAVTSAITIFAKNHVLREIEYHFVNSIEEKLDEINEFLPEPM